ARDRLQAIPDHLERDGIGRGAHRPPRYAIASPAASRETTPSAKRACTARARGVRGMPTVPRELWIYLASRFCSGSAMTMLRAAIAWHVFKLSDSAFHLGLIGLVQFIPALGLSLVGGAAADAYDRRRIMIIAQVVPLAASVWLRSATVDDTITLAGLYAVVFVVAVAASFESPSRAALLPTLVSREQFPRAVTFASTNQALAFVTGPALCGLLIAELGVGAVYAAYGGLVAVSLLGVLYLPSRAPEGPRRAVSLQTIREGLAFVFRSEPILGCMALDMFAVIFAGATALLPIYARDILEVGPRGYGLLTASLEVGALLSSFALLFLPPISRAGRGLLVAVALYGVATVVFGLSRWFPLSVAAYMLVGMADQVSVVLRSTIIQLATPDELRGRVSSVNLIFIGASNQLGAVEAGFVAALTNAPFAVVSGGVASLLVVAIVAVRMKELRVYRLRAQLAH
ncbi:MAG: MFS transporter, partial [Candidatus Binatia bacterium]